MVKIFEISATRAFDRCIKLVWMIYFARKKFFSLSKLCPANLYSALIGKFLEIITLVTMKRTDKFNIPFESSHRADFENRDRFSLQPLVWEKIDTFQNFPKTLNPYISASQMLRKIKLTYSAMSYWTPPAHMGFGKKMDKIGKIDFFPIFPSISGP
jgi:hypothetical protein